MILKSETLGTCKVLGFFVCLFFILKTAIKIAWAHGQFAD